MKMYVGIWLGLVVATVVEVVTRSLPGAASLLALIILLISSGKAITIAMYYQHLRYEDRTACDFADSRRRRCNFPRGCSCNVNVNGNVKTMTNSYRPYLPLIVIGALSPRVSCRRSSRFDFQHPAANG